MRALAPYGPKLHGPLSAAAGLASTIVQILLFRIKAMAKTHEIYGSAEGSRASNLNLNTVAQNGIS